MDGGGGREAQQEGRLLGDHRREGAGRDRVPAGPPGRGEGDPAVRGARRDGGVQHAARRQGHPALRARGRHRRAQEVSDPRKSSRPFSHSLSMFTIHDPRSICYTTQHSPSHHTRTSIPISPP